MSTVLPIEGTAVPEPVMRLADLMSSYPRPWSLCGGWAVDAWLGRTSREHGDVDLSVFDADHAELARHLAGWQLIAHDSAVNDGSTGLWDGGRLPVPSHIHGRAPSDAGPLPDDGVCEVDEGWWLDIQVDGRDGDECVLREHPRIALPMSDAIVTSPWGVPAASPQVLLFFKAAVPRRRDWRDFVALLPRLDAEPVAWLREAITLAYPEHPWLDALSWVASLPRTGVYPSSAPCRSPANRTFTTHQTAHTEHLAANIGRNLQLRNGDPSLSGRRIAGTNACTTDR